MPRRFPNVPALSAFVLLLTFAVCPGLRAQGLAPGGFDPAQIERQIAELSRLLPADAEPTLLNRWSAWELPDAVLARLVTTGVPALIASRTASPKPSFTEGNASTSAASSPFSSARRTSLRSSGSPSPAT